MIINKTKIKTLKRLYRILKLVAILLVIASLSLLLFIFTTEHVARSERESQEKKLQTLITRKVEASGDLDITAALSMKFLEVYYNKLIYRALIKENSQNTIKQTGKDILISFSDKDGFVMWDILIENTDLVQMRNATNVYGSTGTIDCDPRLYCLATNITLRTVAHKKKTVF